MARYDIESIMNEVKAVMTTSLNTRLASIDSEKADAITLKAVSLSSYYHQELNGGTINTNPFVFYGISDIQGEASINGSTSTELTIFAILVLTDEGQDLAIANRMLRYQRALREIFEDNFELPESRVKLSITSQVPVEVTLLNSTQTHRAIGISLHADLG